MASFEIPIKFNLPDDWLDKVVERIKKDDDLVLVTRCKNCKNYQNGGCSLVYGEYEPQPDDFCSYAKPKEMEVK